MSILQIKMKKKEHIKKQMEKQYIAALSRKLRQSKGVTIFSFNSEYIGHT